MGLISSHGVIPNRHALALSHQPALLGRGLLPASLVRVGAVPLVAEHGPPVLVLEQPPLGVPVLLEPADQPALELQRRYLDELPPRRSQPTPNGHTCTGLKLPLGLSDSNEAAHLAMHACRPLDAVGRPPPTCLSPSQINSSASWLKRTARCLLACCAQYRSIAARPR